MEPVLITQNPVHAIVLLSGFRKKETKRRGFQTEVKLLGVVLDHIYQKTEDSYDKEL
jgi:hypothetical protein